MLYLLALVNNVIIQWGNGNAGYTHTYPITYTTVPVVVTTNTQAWGTIAPININDIFINQFTSHCKDPNNNYWHDSLNWISMGY